MSDTESTTVPPPGEFVADADGVARWRAEFDGISVRKVFNGVHVQVYQGATSIQMTLSSNHAAHIARLLREAAE